MLSLTLFPSAFPTACSTSWTSHLAHFLVVLYRTCEHGIRRLAWRFLLPLALVRALLARSACQSGAAQMLDTWLRFFCSSPASLLTDSPVNRLSSQSGVRMVLHHRPPGTGLRDGRVQSTQHFRPSRAFEFAVQWLENATAYNAKGKDKR
ncbi:hypothetical protein IWX90DRAFT_431028 [Phyllosticta citrichinensis]|uniref:Secreted protein n=1 Tax=Phyllosticta citrichinensis TaxID=1130410 RepID=A0ABR1XXA4_9PEZI